MNASGTSTPEVTGTVTYRARIALPPDAAVTVRLLDVSRADAPAAVLAQQTIRTEGRQVPIPFRLTYNPEAVDARARVAVRAEIRDGSGALRWTTTTSTPALTQGAPSEGIEIVVEPVRE